MLISLLDYLKCIDCDSTALEAHSLDDAPKGTVSAGYIRCSNCGSVFPVVHGVPIIFKKEVIGSFLLPMEKEEIRRTGIPLAVGDAALEGINRGQVDTHKNWSFQWLEMDTDTYEKDWGNVAGDLAQLHYYDIPIPPEQYDGKVVCEGSCGFGRVIKVLHERVGRYIAFDLSGAVYKAARLYPGSAKLDVIRANMHHPPFRDGMFDIFFSPRAIHHTGDMDLAIRRLSPILKPGGIFAFSVYSRENNFIMWGIVEPLKRAVNRFLPRSVLLGISAVLAVIVWAVIHFIYLPANKLKITALPLNGFMLVWSKFGYTTLKINVFDLLHAPFAEYISAERIAKWEKAHGWQTMKKELLHDTVWGYAGKKA